MRRYYSRKGSEGREQWISKTREEEEEEEEEDNEAPDATLVVNCR